MNPKNGFGHRLRDARVRKGLDFNSVARRLRIRPDVLRAIEEENFENIPPRGYARNMINSYARFLGLNASDITRDYLEAQAQYDARRAAGNARTTGFDMEPTGGRFTTARSEYEKRTGEPFVRHDSSSRYMSERTRTRVSQDSGSINGLGRRVYSEDSYSPERDRLHSERVTDEANRAHRRRSTSQASAPASESYLNVYGDNVSRGGLMQFLPFVVVGLVIIVLLVFIGSMLMGGGGKTEEVTEIPTSNVESEIVARAAQSAPTSFTFSYELEDGALSWISVTVEGEEKVNDSISGPTSETFECGQQVKFTAGNMDGVVIKVNGEEVKTKTNSDGEITYTMKLSTILDQWVKDHTNTSSDSDSSSSSD